MSLIAEYDLGTARGRIEIDHSDIGRVGDAFVGMGRSFLIGGAALTGGFGYVVNAAANFERQMSAVEAVSDATKEQMEQLSQTALDLGSNSVYGATEVGRAMEQLAKAGVPIETIMNGAAEATVTFAAAAGDELAGGLDEAAVVMANALSIFNGGAEDMEHFATTLVQAAAASTLSVDDMAVSMRYAGPIASTLGFSIDDLSVALGLLGMAGIRGSTAGTSLRGVLLSLTPSSKKAEEAMRDLGLITADGTNRFYELDGSLKSLPEVMDLLGESIEGLSEQERVAAFNAIFQRRAMNSALVLAEAGADGYHEFAESMLAQGSASDIAGTKLDNLSGDMTILRNSIESLIIEAGRPLQDMLREFVQRIQEVVNALGEMDPEILAQIVLFTGIAGAVLTAIGAFLVAVGVVFRLYRNFLLFQQALQVIWGLIAAHPFVVLIALLIALGVAIYTAYQRSETFREIVAVAFQKVQEAGAALVSFFQNRIMPILSTLVEHGRTVGQGLVDAFMSFVGWAQEHVLPVFRSIGDLISATIDRVQRIIGGLGGTFNAAGSLISDWAGIVVRAFQFIIEVIQDAWRLFHDNILDQLINTWNFIKTTIENALQFIRGIIDLVTAVIAGDWRRVWTALGTILHAVWQQIAAIIRLGWETVKELFFTALDAVRLVWENAWEAISIVFRAVWDTITGAIETGLNFIGNIISGYLDFIYSIWSSAWDTITSFLSGAWQRIATGVSEGITAVVGWFSGVKDRVLGALGDLAGALLRVGQQAMSRGRGFFQGLINAWTDIVGWIRDRPRAMLDSLGNLGNILLNAGRSIMNGLWDGLREIWERVKGWLSSLTSWIPDWKGPPKKDKVLLTENGRLIMQGFLRGLQEGLPEVMGLLDSVAPSIESRLQLNQAMASGIGSGSSSSSLVINFNFDGPITPGSEQGVVNALQQSGVIDDILRSARSGRR